VTEPAENVEAEPADGEAIDQDPAEAGAISMSYAEFGARFIHEAVAPQRISDVIGGIAGEAVKVGPLNAGPGGVATARAVGRIGDPSVAVIGEEPLSYAVDIPVDLELDVTVAGTKHHYDIDAVVRIEITVVLAPPLSICIVPASPTYKDVTVDIHPRGLQAKMIGRVGDIERELRKHIARYLRERINTEVSDFSTVELLPLMAKVADQLTKR
jgi:hypothetical protein